MISFKEIAGNTPVSDIPWATQRNITDLQNAVNIIRAAWGKPMTVTSGYRTMQDHLRIYSEKGITDKSKIPMLSQHLFGNAVDIADASGELKAWVNANVNLLEKAGLWCESFDSTPTWVHFQRLPPKSGNRFFKP